MYHRPKILLICLILLQSRQFSALPTINQSFPDSRNYFTPNEKQSLFKPPELEETIEEVQRILAQDPSLPRLTRGEIEELYEKVTREEYQKSIAAGDMGRADSMRALMLVLPYNTDNNTEGNIQELYTRPPVTKVIDTYTSHQPIKFITPDPSAPVKIETANVGNFAATTYKPAYSLKTRRAFTPSPTTYHPPAPAPVMLKLTSPSQRTPSGFQPVTNSINGDPYETNVERNQTPKPVHRYSSHYSAKNAEFLKQRRPKPDTTTTVRPVADVLESLGIVGQTQSRNRFTIDDYYAAESAPQPIISTYVPQTVGISQLKELQGYSLSPKIKPDAYSSFKPLNIGEEIRVKPEVEGYLTRFGIVGGRKRKDLKKTSNMKGQSAELAAGGSEISTAKLPRRGTAAGANKATSSELEKLLENLQELERLNVNPKILSHTTTIRPTTTTIRSTTTPIPTTPNLITNGEPLLIEPKKPRRRIDPNIDINFGNSGNHQTEGTNADQLNKLLENLQELERLRINPDNVLKTIAPTARSVSPARTGALQFPTPTPRTASLVNRFNELALQSTPAARISAQPDAAQLQQVLRQLQTLEQANARTTKKPQAQPVRAGGGLLSGLGGLGGLGGADVLNLQKLLTDDGELERLYEQARARQTGKVVATTTTPKPTTTTTQRALAFGGLTEVDLQRLLEQAGAMPSSTTTAPTTTTTTTTTARTPAPSYREFEQLQKYFAELERTRTSTSTTTTSTTTAAPTTTTTRTTTSAPTKTTTTTTSSTSTTTTTMPTPAVSSVDLAQRITNSLSAQKPKKPDADNDQLQELINRVQHLERLNSAKLENTIRATTTDTPIPFVGFTTRKVNAPSSKFNDISVPSNDFAHLQELYQQVASAEQGSFGRIEISTAATAAKPSSGKRTQNFAQKIIDITNDTGSGSSLQEVDPSDFVQLQKLLSKVQELERVKIHGVHGVLQPDTPTPTASSYTKDFSSLSNLVTSASVHTHTVQNTNGAQIIYPEKTHEYKPFENILKPEYEQPAKSHVTKKAEAVAEPTSSEELRELAMAAPANPKNSSFDKDFEQYQEFFKKLEDEERNSYQNMQPPIIQKTVTREPPRFIATHKPQKASNGQQKADLEEFQKLLSNAQQLEKLGVTLPTELSQQIETKLAKQTNNERAEKQLVSTTARPVHIVTAERPKANSEFGDLISYLGAAGSSTALPTTNQDTTSAESVDASSEKEAFFSLTTPKSLVPKEPKPTTSSALDLPVFSATKIIEAAIKRAANKIGVSTEQPLGFQRRSDRDVYADMDPGSMDDLMGEFSEMNYQLASPDLPASTRQSDAPTIDLKRDTSHQPPVEDTSVDITKDLHELQRLISNLQELQRLNLSVSSDLLRQADAKYLQTLKKQQTPADDTNKSRRQSVTPLIVMAVKAAADEITTASTTTDDSTVKSAADDDADLAPNPVDIEGDTSTAVDGDSATEESSSSSSTTTTEEPRNGSLADLEDSFGGADTNKEEPKPPKRKNGFYFLADWNSFLEVGDGDDQVIVRLSPKIGDPRLFLPVKIP